MKKRPNLQKQSQNYRVKWRTDKRKNNRKIIVSNDEQTNEKTFQLVFFAIKTKKQNDETKQQTDDSISDSAQFSQTAYLFSADALLELENMNIIDDNENNKVFERIFINEET